MIRTGIAILCVLMVTSAARAQSLGTAVSLNGQTATANTSLNMGLPAFTVEFWVNCSGFSGASGSSIGGFLCFGTNQRESWEINGIDSGNRYELQVVLNWPTASIVSFGSLPIFEKNRWEHIAVSYDGTWGGIYRNGELITAQQLNVPVLPTPGGFLGVGNNFPGGSEFANGAYDEIRLWNRALSSEEICANVHTPLVLPRPGLVAYYNFETAGSTPDVSGNNASPLSGALSRVASVPDAVVVPGNSVLCRGGSATLTVSSPQRQPIAWQWRKNGLPINPALNPSAATATLNLSPTRDSDAGFYDCTLTMPCGSVRTTTATLAICAADFDCSGSIGTQDIFNFLAAWFSGDPRADFNGIGGISVQDIFDFLAAYFAGC